MTNRDGSSFPGVADPLSGGLTEATTTGYGYTPPSQTAVAAVSPAAAAGGGDNGGVKVAYVLILLIVGLAVLKWFEERGDDARVQVGHVSLSVRNWLVLTLMAVTGIVAGKALLNIWPGGNNPVTRIFNAA